MVKYGVLYEQGFRAKKNVEERTLKTWPLRKIVFVILYYTRRFFYVILRFILSAFILI